MGKLGSILLNFLVVLLALAGGFYQLYLKSLLATIGYFPDRKIQPTGNEKCKVVPELQACESK